MELAIGVFAAAFIAIGEVLLVNWLSKRNKRINEERKIRGSSIEVVYANESDYLEFGSISEPSAEWQKSMNETIDKKINGAD